MANEFDVVVRGVRESGDRILAKITEVDRAGERIVREGGVLIASRAKREFRRRPAGSARVSHITGRTWYDSTGPFAPQRPRPTQRSGNLRNSIRVRRVQKDGPGRWSSLTGSGLNYAKSVEARGFLYLTPGFEEAKPELAAIYKRIWAETLK